MDSEIAVDFRANGRALPPVFGLAGIVNVRLMDRVLELSREPDGAFSVVQEYPVAEPWGFVFQIPAQALIFREHLSRCVDWNLASFVTNDALRNYLKPKIVSLVYQMGCGRQGFLLDIGVDLVSEIVVEAPPWGSRDAPLSVVERLKVERRVEGSSILGEGGETEICCICLEELQGGESLIELPPCSHLFHEDCIVEWLEVQNSCPLCRRVPYEAGLC